MSILRVFLVDDELPARTRLRRLLESKSDRFEVVGEAGSVLEACEKITLLVPDLLFLDIRLGDGDAFDVLRSLPRIPRIIFATAYSEYAHQAFEHDATDYLLKPVTAERLETALRKIPSGEQQLSSAEMQKMFALAEKLTKPPAVSFPVRLVDRTLFIRFDQITHFEASQKMVYVHTTEKKSYPVDESLTRLAERLPGNFAQIHRAVIVNRDQITEIHRFFGGRYKIVLGRPAILTLESGATFKPVIDGWL